MAERVFLDACVLFPGLVRDLALGAARAELIRPCWSPRVLEEWRIAGARLGAGPGEDMVMAAIAAMQLKWPEALVIPDPEMEAAIQLPDPADAHVLAGARAARAKTLLTFNTRDFPARPLAAEGLAVRHPDGFFWELLSREPERFGAVVASTVAACDTQGLGPRKVLRKAQLPRLGKAWASSSTPP